MDVTTQLCATRWLLIHLYNDSLLVFEQVQYHETPSKQLYHKDTLYIIQILPILLPATEHTLHRLQEHPLRSLL